MPLSGTFAQFVVVCIINRERWSRREIISVQVGRKGRKGDRGTVMEKGGVEASGVDVFSGEDSP